MMADWPTFRKIYATAVPLLKGGRCCESEAHLKNFGKRSYIKMMNSTLAEMLEWLRDINYGKWIQHSTVVYCTSTPQ